MSDRWILGVTIGAWVAVGLLLVLRPDTISRLRVRRIERSARRKLMLSPGAFTIPDHAEARARRKAGMASGHPEWLTTEYIDGTEEEIDRFEAELRSPDAVRGDDDVL